MGRHHYQQLLSIGGFLSVTLVVGITGGIGSGKSAVTDRLQQHGITVVDADLAARIVVTPGRPALSAITQHFGPKVLLDDGSLDRAALRKIVFADDTERQWLEALTHPLIAEEIRTQLATAASPYVALSSPLLLETSQGEQCNVVAVVDVGEQTQIQRTMSRDDNDEQQVRRIMAAQITRQQRLARADVVIDNSGSLLELNKIVDKLHCDWMQRAVVAEAGLPH